MANDAHPADHDLLLVVVGCALMTIGLVVIVNVGPVGLLFVASGLAMIGLAARRSQQRKRRTRSGG